MTSESTSPGPRSSSGSLGTVLCALSLGAFGCGSSDAITYPYPAVNDCSRVYRWEAKLRAPLASEGQYSVRVLLDGVDEGSCTIKNESGEWVMPARGKDGPCAYDVDIHGTATVERPAGGVSPSNFQLTGVSALVGNATPPAHVHVTVSLDGETLVDGETELKRNCGQLLGTVD